MDGVRQTVTAPGAPAAIGPYSHAVRVDLRTGELLFCSGQIPLDPDTGELVGETAGQQARRCLENLEAVCRAAGSTLGSAVRVTIYMTDLGRFGEVNEVYGAFFGADPPARVTVGVAALPKGALVEIDAVVALGSSVAGRSEPRRAEPGGVSSEQRSTLPPRPPSPVPADPEHAYHVELRHFPRNVCRFNLGGEELRAAVLEPWVADRPFELGDLKWDPRQARLTVLEGPRIPPDQLSMGRGWRTAQREGRDVTEQLLAATAGARRA
ncbi:MAG TPA: RidA family protein [Solirubrobacteraceae bacterium]|jgi:2-iminobutanoate/2-iminopropanoate deaminase|nr:RidA family protein [Solirubrobacteraceae bacterium]